MYDKRHLSDGSLYLVFYGHMAAGAVSPLETATDGFDGTPFDLWQMAKNEQSSPGRVIQNIIALPPNNRTMSIKVRESEKAVRFTTTNLTFPGEQYTEYTLDSKRGFSLIEKRRVTRSNDSDSESVTLTLVTDIKQCSGGRWFPMRGITISGVGAKQGVRVRELVVDSVDVDTRPDDRELSFEVPADSEINDLRSAGSQIVLAEKPRMIFVSDLQDLYKKTQEAILIAQKEDEDDRENLRNSQDGNGEVTGRNGLERPDATARPSVIIVVNAVAIIGLLIVVYIRRRIRK
jgi:hypothetical protein